MRTWPQGDRHIRRHSTHTRLRSIKELSPSTLGLSALRGWRREWRRRTRQAGASWRGGAHIQAVHLAQPRPERVRARGQLSHLDHALAAKEARREVLAPAAVEEDAARPRLAYHHEAAVDHARLRRAAPPATARAHGSADPHCRAHCQAHRLSHRTSQEQPSPPTARRPIHLSSTPLLSTSAPQFPRPPTPRPLRPPPIRAHRRPPSPLRAE